MDFRELLDLFNIDFLANQTSHLEYHEAKKYFHGHQLNEATLDRLESRGQPPIIQNIYKMIIQKILGYKIQSIQEVRVSGRQEEDKALAEVLNAILKVFTQNPNFDKEIIKRDRDLIFGLACVELWVKQDNEGDFHLELKHIPTDMITIDKYSNDENALDAKRFHKKINIDFMQAREMFGENALYDYESGGEKRSFLIESWILENEEGLGKVWNRYLWSEKNGIFKKEISPFKTGQHPFIIAKYAIDERNRWYGLFRDIKPLQDFINIAENRIATLMGTFKAIIEEDALDNLDDFIQEMSLDNAVIKVRSGALSENKIQMIQHQNDINNLSQKSAQSLQLAKILSGLNDEALGMAINRQSGTAIAQRRDSGIIGIQNYIKISDDMDRLIHEKAIALICKYFTKEQTFKIVDKKQGERYFSISKNNFINAGKFDLVFKTQLKMQGREERFAHWSEMLKVFANMRPDIAPQLLPLMLKDVDSPVVADIEELLASAEQAAQENAQAQAQAAQQQEQLALSQAQAKAQKDAAQAQKYAAQAELTRKASSGEVESIAPKPSVDLR